jgi:glucose-6-phosphate isomerase
LLFIYFSVELGKQLAKAIEPELEGSGKTSKARSLVSKVDGFSKLI